MIRQLSTRDTTSSGVIRKSNLVDSPPNITPLHLSIITQFYPPDYAATGQLIEELAHNLAKQSFNIKVFTGQPGYAFQSQAAPKIEQYSRLKVHRSRSGQLFPERIRGKAINGFLFAIRSMLYLLRRQNRGDVILLTTAPPFLPVIGYIMHLLFGHPYVCLLYDVYPDIAVNLKVLPKTDWITKLWHWINRRVWRNASRIIVLSPTMRDRIVERCPEASHKIDVIHSWANPDLIRPISKQKNWFAVKHGLANCFTVLYSGNMGRCHDLETLMQAADKLKDENIKFVFIGGGAKRPICMDRAEALGLRNCYFLPYQDKRDLPYSLTACDLSIVSILPGIEGLVAPSKLYSALASGRPIAVICEKHSYLRPLIRRAQCGKTFSTGSSLQLANFIRMLANNSDSAQQMGTAGRHCLEQNFTPEIIAHQYAESLCKAVTRPVMSARLEKYPQSQQQISTIKSRL